MFGNFLKLLALLVPLSHLCAGTKWLIDSPGFDSPAAWLNGHLPCSLDAIVFPTDYGAILPLPKKVDVNGFVLPKDGALLLNRDGEINLGTTQTGRDCANGPERRAILKQPPTLKWYDPKSWRLPAAMQRNTALPHMAQIPCSNESIIIQDKGPLSLDLEYVPFVRMGQLNLAGSVLSKAYLANLINTDIGQLLFKNSLGVRVEYFRDDICGCHRDISKLVEPVCHNMAASYARPHCLLPVMPYESCATICGAVLRFSVSTCDDRKLYQLRNVLAAAIREQKLSDDLDYHVAYVNVGAERNYLQAIVVDRDAYAERSVHFAKQLNASTDWRKLFAAPGAHTVLALAGRPYNPNITFGSILLIILCVLFVGAVGLVMFAHYSPDSRYLNRIPVWLYEPRRWRECLLRSPVAVFARFDDAAGRGGAGGRGRSAADAAMQESIIMGYDAESCEVQERRRAFDNPMFGEAAHRSTAAGGDSAQSSEVPKAQKPEPPTLETVILSDVLGDGGEEQELTEIKLGSSTDDSDSDYDDDDDDDNDAHNNKQGEQETAE